MTYKPFDIQLYRENDDRAKAAVATYLNDQGLYCHVNDDLYGPDLQVYTGYKFKYYVEVEVKRIWSVENNRKHNQPDDVYPWSHVQIPSRKLKLVTSTTKDVEFWVLRNDCKYAIVASDAIVSSSSLVEVSNSIIATGEQFISVPIEQCMLVNLQGE